jgi:hypothetical protein
LPLSKEVLSARLRFTGRDAEHSKKGVVETIRKAARPRLVITVAGILSRIIAIAHLGLRMQRSFQGTQLGCPALRVTLTHQLASCPSP